MEQFDKIEAVFSPKRTDDLQENCAAYIGQSAVFVAMWEIEQGPYEGLWAMQAPVEWAEGGFIGWVPECDLRRVIR